jgi:hypothetical protein
MSLCILSAQVPTPEYESDVPMLAPESNMVTSATSDEASHKVYPTIEPYEDEPDEQEHGESSLEGPSDEELPQRALRSGTIATESSPPANLGASPPYMITDSSPALFVPDICLSISPRTPPSLPNSPGRTMDTTRDQSSSPS